MIVQSPFAMAQGTAPDDPAIRACDMAAANNFDKQRPPDVPGVFFNRLRASEAIPACEAAARVAPQNVRIMYELARAYRAGKRYSDALPRSQQAAQKGYAPAATELAGMYRFGQAVAVDYKAELFYLEQGARGGYAYGQYALGLVYGNGSPALPKDEKISRQWVGVAAQDGYPPAMYALDLMLQKGMGGDRDEVGARYWYEKAANAGNDDGMNAFANALLFGTGGQKDAVAARKWLERSANDNNPDGTNDLGVMYFNGWGGPKDLNEARRLFQKAIDLGEKKLAAKNLAKVDAAAAGH